jgi:hypothetical protein
MAAGMSRFLLLVAALVLSAASAVVPQGYSADDAPGITVITPAQAQASSLSGRPFDYRFADGENGTDLIVRFLRAARAQGASYLSDIEIHLVDQKDGRWQECVTRVAPADHGTNQSIQRMDPGHTEMQTVMRPVTRTVTEYEYRCHMVSRPHMVTHTSYESSYDSMSRSFRSRPVTRTSTEYRMENECHSEPVTRTVTRYEYQYEHRYVPPQWHTELRWISDWQLEESAPVCAPVDGASDVRQPHTIHATIYAAR